MADGVAFLDPLKEWPWPSRDSVSACAASYFLMLTGALENVNDLQPATAVRAVLQVEIEHPLEQLGPAQPCLWAAARCGRNGCPRFRWHAPPADAGRATGERIAAGRHLPVSLHGPARRNIPRYWWPAWTCQRRLSGWCGNNDHWHDALHLVVLCAMLAGWKHTAQSLCQLRRRRPGRQFTCWRRIPTGGDQAVPPAVRETDGAGAAAARPAPAARLDSHGDGG